MYPILIYVRIRDITRAYVPINTFFVFPPLNDSLGQDFSVTDSHFNYSNIEYNDTMR